MKGIIGMHRFNICLVVVLSLSCSGVKTPLVSEGAPGLFLTNRNIRMSLILGFVSSTITKNVGLKNQV